MEVQGGETGWSTEKKTLRVQKRGKNLHKTVRKKREMIVQCKKTAPLGVRGKEGGESAATQRKKKRGNRKTSKYLHRTWKERKLEKGWE